LSDVSAEEIWSDFEKHEHERAKRYRRNPLARLMHYSFGETAKSHAKNRRGHPNAEQDCLLANDRPHATKTSGLALHKREIEASHA